MARIELGKARPDLLAKVTGQPLPESTVEGEALPLPTGQILREGKDGQASPVGVQPMTEPRQVGERQVVTREEIEKSKVKMEDLDPETRKSFEDMFGKLQAKMRGAAPTAAPTAAPPVDQAQPDPQTQDPPQVSMPPSETLAAPPLPAICPQCLSDLRQTTVIEPTPGDKLKFRQALRQPFTKKYVLYGGSLEVTFRTLRRSEISLIYKQVSIDWEKKRIQGAYVEAERLARYRLALSLCEVTVSGVAEPLECTLPMSYDAWEIDEVEGIETDRDTKLVQIADQIDDQVLTTETLVRSISQALRGFNRLVVRLEAMAPNEDFYKASAGPS